MKNWQRHELPRKWRGVGDQECNGKTALREIWKEWEENEEQQQKIEIGDCRQRTYSERIKDEEHITVTMASIASEDTENTKIRV